MPTNIKQMGSIGDGLRIYMEDYVCTYLFQYAESGGFDERISMLVGRFMVIDGQAVLFINGAVQGKYAEEKDGLRLFTEKDFAYAEACIAEHFHGMEIVGWMQSQPSYGVFLNQQYAAYHLRTFTRDYQVMFVTDPMERINAFYACNPERNAMAEVRGYFIYYDKNRPMHDYMLKDRVSEYKTQPPSFIELTRMEHAEDASDESEAPLYERPGGDASDQPLTHGPDQPAHPEEVIRRHQANRAQRKSTVKQRRSMNLLVSLSAVLFLVCFVMGAGLIQNQDRITRMEDELVRLSTAYKNLFVQMNAEGTASVFAAQSDESVGPPEDGVGQEPVHNASQQPADSASQSAADTGAANSAPETNAPAQVIEENTTQAATPSPAPTQTPTPTQAPDESAAQETNEQATDVTASVPESYTIQPGDSLIAISVRFYGDKTRVNDILALNGIENADRIVSGKTIALPQP